MPRWNRCRLFDASEAEKLMEDDPPLLPMVWEKVNDARAVAVAKLEAMVAGRNIARAKLKA
jgi:hypothetical protein